MKAVTALLVAALGGWMLLTALAQSSASAALPAASGLQFVRNAPLGASVTLGRVTKRSHCRVLGALPDLGCTPGARFSRVTAARVCRPGYAAQVRNVTERTRRAVYLAYAIRPNFDGRNGELDHLVSLELGGSNSRANLFPEAALPRPGAHEKDRLENRLHDEVCSAKITLRHAQQLIATDWVATYHVRFG